MIAARAGQPKSSNFCAILEFFAAKTDQTPHTDGHFPLETGSQL
jgi:hypothetical protein